MIAKNCTIDDLYRARALCHDNVAFNRTPCALNNKGTRWAFTLTVRDSKGKYGKLNPINGHRIHALCWHGHA